MTDITFFYEDQTIHTDDLVNYVPFIHDGRVGYRVDKLSGDETVTSTYIYLNPSDSTDDGQPNVFVYAGVENDPAQDSPLHFYDIEFANDQAQDSEQLIGSVNTLASSRITIRDGVPIKQNDQSK